MNPPYGRELGRWLSKPWESAQEGATVVCLVPSRIDIDGWHTSHVRGSILSIHGRQRFGNAANAEPFPSAAPVFASPDLTEQ